MIAPPLVSAIVVTRGDVPLTEIRESWTLAGIQDQVIYNNALEVDLGPHGRFAAVDRAQHDVVFVQDDDVVIEPGGIEELVASYQPGSLVVNLPEIFRPHYPDSAILGFGALFDRGLPEQAFARFFARHPTIARTDPIFLRESCRAFSTLTPRVLVDVPKRDLAWASGPARLWRQPDHLEMRARMLELARQVAG